jgi:hypothetical protein
LKTVIILLSVLSIALGMVVGWLEHEDSRKAAATGRGGEEVIAAPSPPPAHPQGTERRRRSWTPGASEIVSLDAEPAPPPVESGKAEARVLSGGQAPGPAADSPFAPRLDAIAALIEKRRFAEAEEGARDLAEDPARPPPPVREAALRLAARARIFEKILKAIPPGASDPGSAFEVVLANGATIRAAEVDESAGRYVFKLPRGITFSPPREDVLEVRRVTGQPAARTEWKDLAPRVAALSHPIDIFIGGVRPCFQNGLDREGFALLEKLLVRPDSDQIPLLFIPDAGEEALIDWRVAAGRAGAALEGGADLAASAPARPTTPGDATAAPAADAPDPQVLIQVAGLLGEAQALYRSAAGKEGREEDIRQARERLDRALQSLEPLPPGHEAVKKLRRELAQLLSDVSRAVSF